MRRHWIFAITCLLLLARASSTHGVTSFTNKAIWQTAAGNYTTIPFTGYADETFITTQYADLGAVFTDGNDSIHVSNAFLNDDAGLTGNDIIHVSFATSMHTIAVDFPGIVQIDLYSGGALFYSSGPFFAPGGLGGFVGLISPPAFDSAVILKPVGGDVSIDDLHFGAWIPAPGGLVSLALAWMCGRTRRRR